MKKPTIIACAALLGGVIGLTAFHFIHHVLYCQHRTDPKKSHCRVCGHRKACQKYHHKKWQSPGNSEK